MVTALATRATTVWIAQTLLALETSATTRRLPTWRSALTAARYAVCVGNATADVEIGLIHDTRGANGSILFLKDACSWEVPDKTSDFRVSRPDDRFQAGWSHQDGDTYVTEDISRSRCSATSSGESHGICDGFGTCQCAPPFIGDDCSIKVWRAALRNFGYLNACSCRLCAGAWVTVLVGAWNIMLEYGCV